MAIGDDGPESFEDLDYSSPIGDFLGIDFTAQDDFEAQFAEIERHAGRLTQECMAELGFDYTPPDSSDSFFVGGSSDDEVPYFSDEWVAKYGFGITTQRFPQSMVGDLIGIPDEQMGGPNQDFEDPNEEYVEGLSEGEREAYYEALNGDQVSFGPEGPDEDFVYEPSGCQEISFEQAFAEGLGNIDMFYQTFDDELSAMAERAEADPRFVEFNDRVTSCVSDAGLVWVDERELYERWERDLNALQSGPSSRDPLGDAGLDQETMSEREIEEFYTDLFRLDDDQLTRLGELRAEEIALATTVVGCGGGPLNEQVVLGQVRAEYEQEFLDSNADALQEFKSEG